MTKKNASLLLIVALLAGFVFSSAEQPGVLAVESIDRTTGGVVSSEEYQKPDSFLLFFIKVLSLSPSSRSSFESEILDRLLSTQDVTQEIVNAASAWLLPQSPSDIQMDESDIRQSLLIYAGVSDVNKASMKDLLRLNMPSSLNNLSGIPETRRLLNGIFTGDPENDLGLRFMITVLQYVAMLSGPVAFDGAQPDIISFRAKYLPAEIKNKISSAVYCMEKLKAAISAYSGTTEFDKLLSYAEYLVNSKQSEVVLFKQFLNDNSPMYQIYVGNYQTSTPSNTPTVTPTATPSVAPTTTPSAIPSWTPGMTPEQTPCSYRISGYIKPGFNLGSFSSERIASLLSGFRVSVLGTQLTGFTNSEGYFSVAGVPGNSNGYTLEISKPSYLRRFISNVIVVGDIEISTGSSPVEMWPGDLEDVNADPPQYRDDAINAIDLATIGKYFNFYYGQSGFKTEFDIDLDDSINMIDISIISKYFNAIPESYRGNA